MTYSYKDLVERIKNGEDTEMLASELADMLNKAETEAKATLKAEQEKKEAEERRKSQLKQSAELIAKGCASYFSTIGAEQFANEFTGEDGIKNVEKALESYTTLSRSLDRMLSSIGKKPEKKDKTTQCTVNTLSMKEAEDILADFLRFL